MAKKKASHDSPHPATDPHHDAGAAGGHHAPVETEEQRLDRERSVEVEDCWARTLVRPGRLVALLSGSLAFAWLASLTRQAPALSWTWLLLLLFVFGWSLALARGGRPREEEPEQAGGSSGGHH